MKRLFSRRARAILLAIGLLSLVVIVWQAGPAEVLARLAALGHAWPLVLVPSVAVTLIDTLAWRYAFASGIPVGFLALARARIAGEAINSLTPTAYVGGEPVKAYMLAPAVPIREGLSSVIVGKTLMTVGQVAFVALGVVIALGRFEDHGHLLVISAGILLLVTLGLWWVVGRQRRGLLGWLVGVAARVGIKPRALADHSAAIADLDARIARFYSHDRNRLHASVSLYFLGWVTGTAETWVVLRLMGTPVDLPTAFAIEALSGLVKGATFVIPGSVGGQEAGNVALFAGFGLPLAAAVGYSVVRRVRELLWAGLGLVILARAGHPERRETSADD
jgi:glycosyltransferase 2 family protein